MCSPKRSVNAFQCTCASGSASAPKLPAALDAVPWMKISSGICVGRSVGPRGAASAVAGAITCDQR
jgi:hypothetical protein